MLEQNADTTDLKAGSIRGSLNLPAQTIWHSLDTLYNLCDAACLSSVIFYCGRFILFSRK